jgi:hypothetical protein
MAESKQKDTAHANGNGRRVLGPKDVHAPARIEEFTVEGHEGVFRLQEIFWRAKEEIDLAAVKQVPGPKGPTAVRDGRMYMPRIVAAAWVDEKGERYYKTMADAEDLGARGNLKLIEALYQHAAKMNGFAGEEREEVGKDSSGTPTDSGGTTSASPS